ncbi:DoxX family protein [Acidobacterium sp. S8]|uniref:DoxX family protein n=1 Tax=Acidobacterium sp. S8 TaxID=1641854 RepID=UPI00131CA41C|nr:DoxX family protein [Acidobacterium sp. S8]
MTRNQQPALTLFAAGMIGLGIIALIYGDFALVWQPVAPWVPGRTALAYASGVIMLFGGIGLLFEATVTWSIRILFPYLILWLLLKAPALFVAPLIEGVWLGFGELAILMAGGWVLFARLGATPDGSVLNSIGGENGVRMARILFALAILPIGLAHIIYVKETAALVPPWLPFRTGWAYITGVGQIACGAGILLSILPRVAAMIEAGMISSFALLVWAPALVTTPKTRFSTTAFLISWAIAAGAWVVAFNTPAKKSVPIAQTIPSPSKSIA